MKRLTGKYENGTAYYNIVPGESTIDRLVTIEDILGDEYDLDELSKAMAALRRERRTHERLEILPLLWRTWVYQPV